MLGKIIVHANDRDEARTKLIGCLEELKIQGIKTNTDFLSYILNSEIFRKDIIQITDLDDLAVKFKKLLPSIFSSGVTQINILIGTIIASFQAGAVSYLYYADRIYQINLAIAGIAIGTVILPKLSSYIAQKKLKDVDLIQNKSLELSLFLSLPAMAGLLIASEEIVSSLFGYGSFNKEGVEILEKHYFIFP